MRIVTIGGTEKGGTTPLKPMGNSRIQRDQTDEVSYKIKQTGLSHQESKKGGYVSGNNTKEVIEYIKKPWTLFSETEFESTNGRFSIAISVVYRFWFCGCCSRSFREKRQMGKS
jgi:Ca-activated chloride channel family protein